MRKLLVTTSAAIMVLVLAAGPALACGGLLAPNGSVQLLKTSTLAAYVDGIEHYVTSFKFVGGGAKFGSIVPLPGIPDKVVKGGDWTLQRLLQEVEPPAASRTALFAAADASESAKVLLETQIDALKITILEGGGDEVGRWAGDNGFELPPDAPEVLDFYAARSPIFMAARFDAADARSRGFQEGDGTPVHLTIPTEDPWVPLRILGLGKDAREEIEADVFLLTESAPQMLPRPGIPGLSESTLTLQRHEPASPDLLADLRSDRGMKWLPESGMWLTYLQVDASAGELKHDLALDVTGGSPSPVAAGLVAPSSPVTVPEGTSTLWAWVLAAGFAGAALYAIGRTGTARG